MSIWIERRGRLKPLAMAARRTQKQRSETTTAALVDAARRLFAEKGFAETSIDDIIAAVGVTRGALYHHFDSKTELFRAVFEAQEETLTEAVAAAAAGQPDSWSGLQAGSEAFVNACLDPATQRILLIDAPSVIGWEAMREIESRYALALLRGGLEGAVREGRLEDRPLGPLTHLLLGALSECAMAIARDPDPPAMAAQARGELIRLLNALAKNP